MSKSKFSNICLKIFGENYFYASKEELRADKFMQIINEKTINADIGNLGVYDELAYCICDLIWRRDNWTNDLKILNDTWRVKSDNLTKDTKDGVAQRTLLNAFWNKVRTAEYNGKNDKLRLDNLTNAVFDKADPIILGAILHLFSLDFFYKIREQDNWTKCLLDRMKEHKKIGLLGRTSAQNLTNQNKRDEFYKDRDKRSLSEYKESIAIGLHSNCLVLSVPNVAIEYTNKLQTILESDDLQEMTDNTEGKLDPNRINFYSNLLYDIKKELQLLKKRGD